ncbi:ShlB/FhaC/HecB family hemolysin secretion/activation protein [Roseomonas stagni]|uniref:ShlB/FhaC/HecB family hemolysin secretion/activation protein n=1 Tax=Falsiroseomonas algicola TaxID=2716930 RepID=A0A6M1LFK6_9PROT|nr:ShlB/FhaC/HecB family hemolysin secretion/activation protein [Falsiroseomonas algicola]NGM18839.1 ShlB/FhaC/HecB family hemolysin secretion/activation protein [Falsiroseomonas algicola]
MRRPRLALLPIALGTMMPGGEALAQVPPPLPGIIERVAPAEAPALGPALLPPEPQATTGPGAARRLVVGRITITGNTALPAALLRPSLLEGQDATLAEVEEARLAILGTYRAAGFAYVAVAAMASRGEAGRIDLRFAVTEGFIADIALEGADIGPAEQQVRRFLAPLIGQRPLPHAALERALLLAGDIPGMEARGLLRPIEGDPGALQLLVRLTRRPLTGFASLDNRGYSLTGAWQALLVGQANSLTRFGERTELALLRTDANGQGFAQLSQEWFIGGSGLKLRAFAGAGRAAPGSALAALGYLGETRVAGIGLSHPLIRSRPRNLLLTAQVDAFDSEVQTRPFPGTARQTASRDSVRALRIGAEAQAQDAWLPFTPAAATSTATLRLHRGLEAFGASDGSGGGTARAGSDFGFTRIVLEASRLQPLLVPAEGWLLSAYGIAAAQWTDDWLPPAEKFYLGGNRLGRGFHAGQLSGDRAVAGTAELQLATEFDLRWPNGGTRLGTQFYLFRDEGRAADNGSDIATRHLASWGGGVRLQFDDRAQIDVEAVRRLTRAPEGAGVRVLEADGVYVRLLLRY